MRKGRQAGGVGGGGVRRGDTSAGAPRVRDPGHLAASPGRTALPARPGGPAFPLSPRRARITSTLRTLPDRGVRSVTRSAVLKYVCLSTDLSVSGCLLVCMPACTCVCVCVCVCTCVCLKPVRIARTRTCYVFALAYS